MTYKMRGFRPTGLPRQEDRVPEGDVAIRQGLSMRSRRAMLTMTGDKAERKAHHKDHCIQTIRGE